MTSFSKDGPQPENLVQPWPCAGSIGHAIMRHFFGKGLHQITDGGLRPLREPYENETVPYLQFKRLQAKDAFYQEPKTFRSGGSPQCAIKVVNPSVKRANKRTLASPGLI